MDVKMPDGTVITNVPDSLTQSEILARYNRMQGNAEPQASVQVSAPSQPVLEEYPQWNSTSGGAATGRPRMIDRTNVQTQPRPLESFTAGTIKGGIVDPILGTAQLVTGGNLGTSDLAQQVGQQFSPYQQDLK